MHFKVNWIKSIHFTLNMSACILVAKVEWWFYSLFFFFPFKVHRSHICSRVLCKWNHAVWTVLGLASFTQHNYSEIHPCCWISIVPPLLSWNSIPFYVYITMCLSIHLLLDLWVVSSLFGGLQIKFLWTFMCKFLRGHIFPFLWINT